AGAILQIEIVSGSHTVEVVIDIFAPFQAIELAPCLRVDARFVRFVPGDEVEHRGVIVFGREQGCNVVDVVWWDERGERGNIDSGANIIMSGLIHDGAADRGIAKTVAGALDLTTW